MTVGSKLLYATDQQPDILFNGPPDGWVVDTLGDWRGPTTIGSVGVQSGGASVLPAFMRATSLIVDTLCGLPWRLIRDRDTMDAPRWIADPHLLRPDGRLGDGRRWPGALNRIEFWSQVLTSTLWHGNGYVWVAQDTLDGPRPGFAFLKVLNPSHVGWDDGDYTIGGEPLAELGGRLLHFRGLPPYDGAGFGVGVLRRHALDLGLAEAVRGYAANTLRSGIPNGYLRVTSQNLTEDAAKALKARWMEAHGDTRSIAVLNASTEFTPLAISPLDAQLIEQKRMTVADIALMFGVEPTMLGAPSGDSATYANVEQRMLTFWTHTLQPWARRIEETLSAEVPHGSWVEMDMRGLLRGDSMSRASFYASALDKGWMTVDEVRAIERLPVMPNEPLPAQPEWPGRGPELPTGPHFTDPTVTPEQFTEEPS
jgi:HK97 family phage portal protein